MGSAISIVNSGTVQAYSIYNGIVGPVDAPALVAAMAAL